MGTWGIQNFENDTALDLKAEFEEKGVIVLGEVLNRVNSYSADLFIEAPDCEAAIAAAAIVVSLNEERSQEDNFEVLSDLKLKALTALKKIKSNSELKDLWAEGENDYTSWVVSLDELLERLK